MWCGDGSVDSSTVKRYYMIMILMKLKISEWLRALVTLVFHWADCAIEWVSTSAPLSVFSFTLESIQLGDLVVVKTKNLRLLRTVVLNV